MKRKVFVFSSLSFPIFFLSRDPFYRDEYKVMAVFVFIYFVDLVNPWKSFRSTVLERSRRNEIKGLLWHFPMIGNCNTMAFIFQRMNFVALQEKKMYNLYNYVNPVQNVLSRNQNRVKLKQKIVSITVK
jgi:hypothetical protein